MHICTMEVRVQSSTIIPQPNPETEAYTEAYEIPLTVFDRFASDMHIAVLVAFSPPTPPNEVIIDGLIKVLAHFPPLTGEFGKSRSDDDHKHRPCVIVGGSGGGALVVEAAVESKLADHLPLEPHPDFELLQPSWEGLGNEAPPHMLQVQLNRFACGGIIIGVTAHHRVADGRSMGTFFIAWGQTIRGVPIDTLPSYDSSWLNPRSPPRCEFEHWGYEFMPKPPHPLEFPPSHTEVDTDKITNLILHYSSDYITTELKRATRNKYSTFETLLGHIWRKITTARGLDDETSTMIRVSVNGRSKLKRNVPSVFFGNLVLNAYPNTKAKGLIEGGVGEAARVVHEAILKIGNDYFESFVDFGVISGAEELVPVYDLDMNVLSPNLEVDSWSGFRFNELDFGGGGGLCGFMPTWVPVDGLMIFLPSVREGGGIDIFLGLREEHARILRQISHFLD